MAAINVGIDTDDWLKVEREGWVGATGWALLVLAIGALPFRMYPLYWFTGLRVETMADPIAILCVSAVLVLAAIVMFSQPRSASAERSEGKIVLETGFTQVVETEIPFGEVSSVTVGAHPLWPVAKRVMVATKSGKTHAFAWTGDGGQAKHLAERLTAMTANGAPDAPAADPAPEA